MKQLNGYAIIAAALCLGAGAAGAQDMNAHTSQDANFVRQAAKSGTEEVADGKTQRTSSNAGARTFASRMVRDHTKANTQLQAIAQRIGMSAQLQAGIQAAKAPEQMPGAEYLRKEIGDHRQAIALFKTEAANGNDGNLRQYARATLPALMAHLLMAERYSGSSGSM
ncbi:MAG TPA: DUF4142 domain-containing protein [Candidatus Baltobacteraceae bacterium]|jgi:putative membrane protein|nr:DUF4142 domain-containing protein [Candidatus Baltobacteraceae bacterium]